MGYTGGSAAWPTYQSIGDYTEALRVTFDPALTSYEEILKVYFNSHSPMPMAFTGSQYRSAIYWHTREQELVAERLRAEIRPSISKNALLVEAADFFRGEEYHQHWLAKQTGSRSRI